MRPATPVTPSPPRACGGVPGYPAPLPPTDATSFHEPDISAIDDEHDDKNPGRCPDPAPLRRSGELRYTVSNA